MRMPSRKYCSKKPSSRLNCGLPVASPMARWKARSSSTPSRPSASAVSIAASARLMADLRARGALRGHRGDLALEHAPHLDHVDHRVHRIEHRGVEGQRLVDRGLGHVHARTLARQQQAARLELVHRLAHDGARDTVRHRDLLLAGQPVARPQRAAFELRREQRSEPVRQPLGDQAAATWHRGSTDRDGTD
jgi:hypothetical protein